MPRKSYSKKGAMSAARVAKIARQTMARAGRAKVYLSRDALARAEELRVLGAPQMDSKGQTYPVAGSRGAIIRNVGWRGRGDYTVGMGLGAPGSWLPMPYINTEFSGRGDYSVKNAIVGDGISSAGIPVFAPHQAEYTVTKTEFLQAIYAPSQAGVFTNTIMKLQPGLQETFPWLGLIAPNFEEYEMKQLMFYWRPMVTDFNSGTGQCGEIIMVTQYNPSDAPFTDTLRAKSYDGAMSCKTSVPMMHGVECEPSRNSGASGKYIRTGPLEQGEDLKQYDQGNLNVIVNDTPPGYNNQLLGEIWCAYTVCLRKPKLPQSTGDIILRDYFESVNQLTAQQPAFWTQQTILTGQQNRIGCKVFPLSTDAAAPLKEGFRVELPNWYTGDLRVTLMCQFLSFPPGLSTVDFPIVGYPGVNSNVTQISDLLSGTAGDVYGQSDAPAQISGAVNAVTQGNLQFSIRVGTPIGGAKNYVYLAVNPNFSMVGWSIDITEYNSGFNNPGTGHPILLDYQGQIVAN